MRVTATILIAWGFMFPTPTRAEEAKPEPAHKEAPSELNDKFLDPDLDPAEWVKRWESESREIFVARHELVTAAALAPGMRVADVGAGTGLFVELFAGAVGTAGKVYALDISPKFVAHMTRRAAKAGLDQVTVKRSTTESTTLPDASVDIVFLCDTYHHFEHPEKMLRSIRNSLRDNGRLIVVDFERIEGESREWVLGHVRTGKKQVVQEIAAVGFRLIDEVDIDELHENYCLRFEKLTSDDRP